MAKRRRLFPGSPGAPLKRTPSSKTERKSSTHSAPVHNGGGPIDPELRGQALRSAILSPYEPFREVARRQVLATLEAHGGNVSATAAELEIAVSTLYDWRRRDTELARGFAELAQGRAGSRRAAAMARRMRSSSRPPPSTRSRR